MHSSRMHTAYLLTVSRSTPCISGMGVCPTPLPGGRPPRCRLPMNADPPVMWPVMHAGKLTPLWAEGMTHACENITLSQTSFAGGNNGLSRFPMFFRWLLSTLWKPHLVTVHAEVGQRRFKSRLK